MLPHISLHVGHNDIINERYLLFNVPDLITNSIKSTGGYTREFAEYAAKILNNTTKDVLDIGANVGTFAIPLAKMIKGNVYCYEVQRIVYYQLCANVILNHLENVFCYHKCITYNNYNKSVRIPVVDFSNPNNIGAYSLNYTLAEINLTDKCEDVETLVLDDTPFDNIGFIKIDVEGAEIHVLRGLVKTIQKNNYPPILFECWSGDWFKEQKALLFKYIHSIGYFDIVALDSTNFVATKSSDI